MAYPVTCLRVLLLSAACAASPLVLAASNESAPAVSTNKVGQQQATPQQAAEAAKGVKQRANPLNLTAPQQQALAELRGTRSKNEQEIRQMESKLMELATADAFDKAKVEALAKQIAKKSETNLIDHSIKMNAFYKTLNPEQQKQFKAFEERRRKMMEQRRGQLPPGKPPQQQTSGQQPPAAPKN